MLQSPSSFWGIDLSGENREITDVENPADHVPSLSGGFPPLQSSQTIDVNRMGEPYHSLAILDHLAALPFMLSGTSALETTDAPADDSPDNGPSPHFVPNNQCTPRELYAEEFSNQDDFTFAEDTEENLSFDIPWEQYALLDSQINISFGFGSAQTVFSPSPILPQDAVTTADDYLDDTLCPLQLDYSYNVGTIGELEPDTTLAQSIEFPNVLSQTSEDSVSLKIYDVFCFLKILIPYVKSIQLSQNMSVAPSECDSTIAAQKSSFDKPAEFADQLIEPNPAVVVSNTVATHSRTHVFCVWQDYNTSFGQKASSPALQTEPGVFPHHDVDITISKCPVDLEHAASAPSNATAMHRVHDSGLYGNIAASPISVRVVTDGVAPDAPSKQSLPANAPISATPISSSIPYPHSADQPNWALAPYNPTETKPTVAKRPARNDDRRVTSGKEKQTKEDTSSKKKAVKFQEPRMPSSGSDDNVRLQLRVPTPPQPNSIGRGRRPRGASVSLFSDPSIAKTIIPTTSGHNLSRISETVVPNAFQSTRLSALSGNPRKKEESVEDKIAAIILETRRSKPGKLGQTLTKTKTTLVDVAKAVPEIRISPPSSTHEFNRADELPRKGRVSWPASEEHGLQSNARPPLPWRTGIGRALTTHLTSTPALPTTLQDIDKRDRRDSGLNQEAFKETTLHLGHEDFPLHGHERDGPVRVNLPIPSKTRNEQHFQQSTVSKSVSATNMSSPSTFHSSIPVSNRVFANKAVGPSDIDLTPFATHLKQPTQPTNDGWQRSQTFLAQNGPVSNNPPSSNFPRPGHRNGAMSQHSTPLQNVQAPQQPQTYSRMPKYTYESNWPSQSGGEYSSRNFPHTQMPDLTPNFPAEAVVGNHEQLHQARQHANTQDLLNHWYMQGQQRARDHLERTALNRPRSTVFADQFQGVNDDHQDTIDGWRSSCNVTHPPYLMHSNSTPQNYRNPVYESTLPPDANHARQQYPNRRVSDPRERYNVPM